MVFTITQTLYFLWIFGLGIPNTTSIPVSLATETLQQLFIFEADTIPKNRIKEEEFGRRNDFQSNSRKKENSRDGIRTAPKEYEVDVSPFEHGGIPVSDSYTGYLIEIAASIEPLAKDHKIFRRHGRILINRKSTGELAYYIGSFSEKEAAQRFLDKMLLPLYPNAIVIPFSVGRRQNP